MDSTPYEKPSRSPSFKTGSFCPDLRSREVNKRQEPADFPQKRSITESLYAYVCRSECTKQKPSASDPKLIPEKLSRSTTQPEQKKGLYLSAKCVPCGVSCLDGQAGGCCITAMRVTASRNGCFRRTSPPGVPGDFSLHFSFLQVVFVESNDGTNSQIVGSGCQVSQVS